MTNEYAAAVDKYWQKEIEGLGGGGETLSQRHFVRHKFHMDWTLRQPGPNKREIKFCTYFSGTWARDGNFKSHGYGQHNHPFQRSHGTEQSLCKVSRLHAPTAATINTDWR
jgi:hypothetical protein